MSESIETSQLKMFWRPSKSDTGLEGWNWISSPQAEIVGSVLVYSRYRDAVKSCRYSSYHLIIISRFLFPGFHSFALEMLLILLDIFRINTKL